MTPSLTNFRALSFDCYGTLIDWETGILSALAPLLSLASSSPTTNTAPTTHPLLQSPTLLLQRFRSLCLAIQTSHPTTLYTSVLEQTYHSLASELLSVSPPTLDDDAKAFGESVGSWPAFPDTLPALRRLAKRYQLVILSNVDDANLARTLAGPLQGSGSGVEFARCITAEEVGSYKPSHGNFEYLFKTLKEELGVEWNGGREGEGGLLHVAKSLAADHVPAKELGLRSVWIARGREGDGVSAMGGTLAELQEEVGFGWRFGDLGEMADAVDRAFEGEG